MTFHFKSIVVAASLMASIATSAFADPGAFLEISLTIAPENRKAAAAIYTKYKQPFLSKIKGAQEKVLLVRDEDVQVLHGFDTVASATNYLSSELFTKDVFVALKPYFVSDPEIRIYEAH